MSSCHVIRATRESIVVDGKAEVLARTPSGTHPWEESRVRTALELSARAAPVPRGTAATLGNIAEPRHGRSGTQALHVCTGSRTRLAPAASAEGAASTCAGRPAAGSPASSRVKYGVSEPAVTAVAAVAE